MASHKEVAHRWAQDDASARTLSGFNMFYERAPAYSAYFAEGSDVNRIYSHGRHYVAASFVTTKAGERVVLVNSYRYSMTTGRHLSYIRSAIPSRYPVFEVPFPDPSHKPGGSENFHADNLQHFVKEAGERYAKGMRARVYKDQLLKEGEAFLNEAERYAKAFGVKWKRPSSLDAVAGALAKEAAKRAKVEAKARAEREERARQAMEAQRINDAEAFGLWSRGAKNVRCPQSYRSDDNGNAYVRRMQYDDGTDELQTSQGASVPWDHAVKAFRFIALCVARGEAWERNGRQVRVGHYQLDRIEPNGDMTAGCHRFGWEAMRALAEREGVQISGVTSGDDAKAIVAEAVTVTH